MREKFEQAFDLRKQKNFKEALAIYRPLWQQGPSQFDDWAGWSFSYCLKETGQYEEALDLCRQLYPRFPSSTFIRQLYASCIYYTQFGKKGLPPLPVLKKAVQAMIDLYPPHEEYSLSAKAIFKLIKAMAAGTSINWAEIETWLRKMDPDQLDSKSFTIKMPDGKIKEFASPLEEWYSWMIRVKGGMNKPEELLQLLGDARKRNIRWHYSNDIWLARKEAFALGQLGKKKDAETILRKLITQKQDWFLLSDLADIVEDNEEALQLMARAALSPGPVPLKVKLFQNMYRLLKENSVYADMAEIHLLFIVHTRQEQGWPVPAALAAAVEKANTDTDSVNSAKEAVGKLRPFWKKIAEKSADIHSGKIKLIFPNRQSGIVRADDGKEYYFAMRDVRELKQKATAGTLVNFQIAPGFNKKKNIATTNAVRLTHKTINE